MPGRPQRVVVAGVSGCGKSSLAAGIGQLLDLPYTEMDALYHGPHWTPRASFLDEVEALVAGERWVTEWQYSSARPLLAARADLLVWLDLPYPLVLWRVVRRTLRRRLRREVLWNGNREGPLRTFFTDPEHVVRWSWRSRHVYDAQVPALGAERPNLAIVRLRSRRQVERWIGDLGSRT